ncbi:MAG: LPS export ABC transporter periplasmic protein LptC [Sphingobacteriia bacterium]|nr:LPS export ABC transporter periplasmic protein LptC [Sphingobacteriia bacterium]
MAIGSFFACENDIKKVQEMDSKKIGIEEAKTLEIFFSNGGKLKARLTSPFMQRFQFDTPRIIFPQTLHVDFYDSLKNHDSELFARYGEYYEGESKLLLKDSVIAFNVRRDTLWTSELHWDQANGKYYTDKKVILSQNSTPRQKIIAIGFESDQDLKNIVFRNVGKKFTGEESFMYVPDSTLK